MTVTIPPSQPSADTVSPNFATGSSQTFTFVFSDSQSAANLTGLAMLFSSSLSFTNACAIVVDRIAGTVVRQIQKHGGNRAWGHRQPTARRWSA